MMQLDYIFILIYFIIMLYIGRLASKRVFNKGDYLLAGKRVGKIPTALSTAATDFGGAGLIGAAGLAYSKGIAGGWWNFCAIPALMILGVTLAKVYRKLEISTVPEYLEKRYDLRTRILAAILHLIGTIFAITAQTIVASMVITTITGIPKNYAVLTATLVFVAYTTAGGLIAVIWTDIFAYLVLMLGLIAALIFSMINIGGLSNVINNAPPSFWSMGSIGWMEPAAWIGMNFFWYSTSQYFVQRLLAAKDDETAQFAYVYTGINYIIYGLIVALLGICAYIIVPGIENPEMAIPSIIKYAVPVGLRGILLASILAATMSSSSSYLNACASIFTIDIYKRIINPRANDIKCLFVARWSTVIIALIALFASYFTKGVIEMVVYANIIYSAGIFFPIILGIKTKLISTRAAFYSIIVGGVVAVISKFWLYQNVEGILGDIHPMFMSSIASLIILLSISIIANNMNKD